MPFPFSSEVIRAKSSNEISANLLPADIRVTQYVRTVCSCQPSDFSAKSRHRQQGRARRSERTARHSGAAPSISLSLRGRREALRLRSFTLVRSFVRTYACTYVRTCTMNLRMHRVRVYLSNPARQFYFFLSRPHYRS